MERSAHPQVRVRFAPSPTGFPHVGNIRTALFNWLFARHHGGVFVLRIEDTDVSRRVEGAVEAILDSLQWLGLDWDEGPVFQSDRLALYQAEADRMIRSGHAYRCFCTPERLEQVRAELAKRRLPPRYDGHCRNLEPDEVARRCAAGEPSVVRFKMPREGETTFTDLIHGNVTFSNKTLSDYVLLKSDGYPTYHLANVVDDHYMGITHVLRADEWISSTPLHILIYNALGWEPAAFAHLPMILGPDKSKLSKRHGATTVSEYRDAGYLPEAIVNFLALLGWSLDDKTDLLTREELVANFSLERINKTAAVFNKPKLDWMNGIYIRKLSPEEFAQQAIPYLERDLPPSVPRPLSMQYVIRVGQLVQERIKLLGELGKLCDFFFVENITYPPETLLVKGLNRDTAVAALSRVLAELNRLDNWSSAMIEGVLRPLSEETALSTRQLFGMIRVAVTGKTATPPLFETMNVLGRERCILRIQNALKSLRDDSSGTVAAE
ncbi:MAG TPA: glutamate--tRNA ligase [Dehalococcoidia bacterium]|nr:glutamate--tRNA ligase [Dehalococcoidia bacterium]